MWGHLDSDNTLVFTSMDFFLFVLLSLAMITTLKTNIKSLDQMNFENNISADNLDKPYEKF